MNKQIRKMIIGGEKVPFIDEKEEVKVFENEELGFSIRGIKLNGEGWLVGKDIAEVLRYSNSSDALRNHVDEDDKKQIAYRDLQKLGLNDFGTKGGWLINESGLYSLILRSDMPQAKKFKAKWNRYRAKEIISMAKR